MSLLKRSPATTVPLEAESPGSAVECRIVLPCLHEFLTLQRWDDGCQRRLGTISLFWEEGWWKCWLNDKDGGRSVCVSASSLNALLLLVDERLHSDTLEWRKARPEQGRAGRK